MLLDFYDLAGKKIQFLDSSGNPIDLDLCSEIAESLGMDVHPAGQPLTVPDPFPVGTEGYGGSFIDGGGPAVHECSGPLWPCALTGAAAALAGIEGVGVVIHGSLGCYYYPSSVLHLPLYCSSITDRDIILGSEGALVHTINAIRDRYRMVAVLCTCIPAITGEDLKETLEEKFSESTQIRVIDAPGFSGEYEEGFRSAIRALDPTVSHEGHGVNIDGLSPFDPFHQGNFQEAMRLLASAGATEGAALSTGTYRYGELLSPYTLHSNPDLGLDLGESLGSLVGLSNVKEAFERLEKFSEKAKEVLDRDIPSAEGKIAAACDRYLKRFDPPTVALFGQCRTMQAIA